MLKIGPLSAIIFVLMLSACAQKHFLLKTHFEESAVPPVPDYSNPKNWAALPGIDNGSNRFPVDSLRPKDSLAADVFFIHPTTFTGPATGEYKWNADVNDEALNTKTDNSTIFYQASVFNGAGKIYAPRYRQAHLSAFYTNNKQDHDKALNLAYQDVKAAFQYYLDHYNHGRPIIIASHSQGTVHALRILKEFFDGKPLQKQLVVAYLIGMPIPGDSLCCIAPCHNANETDCWLSWNTLARDYYPPYYNNGLNHAICTNPLTWTTDSTYAPSAENKGGILRDFNKIIPGLSDAQVHNGMLWVGRLNFRGSALFHFKIYHILDYNLFYMNLRQNAINRARVFKAR